MAIKFPELSYKNIPVDITTDNYTMHGLTYNEPIGSHGIYFKKPYNNPVSYYIRKIYMNNDGLTNFILRNEIFCMYYDEEWDIVKLLKPSDLFESIENQIDPACYISITKIYAFCANDKQVMDIKMRL